MENFRLRVFRTVAQSLSFRQAAEELFLTQPAISQNIKALEDELGTALFNRTGGRVSLTPAGAILHGFADRLKLLADEATQAIAEAAGTDLDQLRVGASQTIGQYLLPNLLARFLKLHPRLSIQGTSGNTEEVLLALADQRIDLALIEGPALRSDIKTQPFMEDHMVLVVPPGHDWIGRDVAAADLAAAAFVTREVGSGSRRVVEAALETLGISPKQLQITMTLDSTEGLLSAVEAGLGVAFVSRWAVRNQLTLGTLRVAHVAGLSIARTFSAAFRSGLTPTGSAGAFLRFLHDNAFDLAPRPTGNPANPTRHRLT